MGKWVSDQLGSKFHADTSAAIGLVRDGILVAAAMFTDYNGRSAMIHWVIAGRITRQFLWAISAYAFLQCGLQKLIGPIVANNDRAIHLVKNLGFVEEARIADAHPDGDLILYTLTKSNCRFLSERYGKNCTGTANT